MLTSLKLLIFRYASLAEKAQSPYGGTYQVHDFVIVGLERDWSASPLLALCHAPGRGFDSRPTRHWEAWGQARLECLTGLIRRPFAEGGSVLLAHDHILFGRRRE